MLALLHFDAQGVVESLDLCPHFLVLLVLALEGGAKALELLRDQDYLVLELHDSLVAGLVDALLSLL